MNAGLGNRDAYRGAKAVSQDDGRVICCPLCFLGPNNQLHLVMHYWCLVDSCLSLYLLAGVSLTTTIESVKVRNDCVSDEETLWMFLGQEGGLSRLDLVDRGLGWTS